MEHPASHAAVSGKCALCLTFGVGWLVFDFHHYLLSIISESGICCPVFRTLVASMLDVSIFSQLCSPHISRIHEPFMEGECFSQKMRLMPAYLPAGAFEIVQEHVPVIGVGAAGDDFPGDLPRTLAPQIG